MFHIDITYSFPIPKPTVDLLQSVRLKWQAEQLGFKKLVIKKSKMLAYFVSNPDATYYQSDIFGKILQTVQQSGCCQFKEKKIQSSQRLYLFFDGINSVDIALKKISELD